MVFEKETKKSMVYEIYEHFFVVYEIFADIINSQEFNSINSLTLNSCLLLDQAATQLTSYIQEAAKANIPILDLGPKSKP